MNEKIEQMLERMYGPDLTTIAEFVATSISDKLELDVCRLGTLQIMTERCLAPNRFVIAESYLAVLQILRFLPVMAEKYGIERSDIINAAHMSIVEDLNDIEKYEIGI